MRWLMMAVALAAGLSLAACGGDGGDGDDKEVSAEFQEAAAAAVADALLTSGDLPGDWEEEPADTDEDELDLEGDCAQLNDPIEGHPDTVASDTSNDFSGPDDQTVSSAAAVFASEDKAGDVFDEFNDLLSDCKDDLLDALETVVMESIAGEDEEIEVDADVSFDEIDFADLGDESSAHRLGLTLTAGGITLETFMDMIVFREGSMLGGVFYMAFGGADSAEEEIAGIVAGKVAAANDSLPD